VALGALLLGLGAILTAHESRLVQRLTAPPEDGAWAAVSLDGRPVPAGEYRLSISGGRVGGGRDGCNDWSFEAPDETTGERRIFTTLVGCDENDPLRRAYGVLAFAEGPVLQLRPDGSLRIAARGHEGLFRRCRWVEAPLPPGTSGSGPPRCAID